MKDEQVRSVGRALALLKAMNAEPSTTLHQLHLQLGLPKATLSRLLGTLIAEGYVQPGGVAGRYRLTAQVQELASGYTQRSLIVDVGSPLALQVTREIRWPLAIGTLDGDAVVVRFSTMPYSPLAVHATTVGQRLGLLDTAMGRAYLAHCDARERAALFELLAAASPGGQLVGQRNLEADLRLVRHEGYAVRMPNARRSSATIAVPVMSGASVPATLCLTTFGRLMTPRLVNQYLPVLKDTAQAMSRAYEARLADR